MTVREFVHKFAAYYLRSIYLKVFVFLSVFLAAATRDWTPIILVVGAPAGAALAAHLTRPKLVDGPSTPRLDLKAPSPRPGQCPVCSLEDLDELAVDDEFAREIDPDLARVVAYGPDRAHFACAAVVPYKAPTVKPGGVVSSGAPALLMQRGMETTLNSGRVFTGSDGEQYYSAATPKQMRRWLAVIESGADRIERTIESIAPTANGTLRASLASQADAHLPWSGSHSWEQWQRNGFETRAEAAAWYRLGFARVQIGRGMPLHLAVQAVAHQAHQLGQVIASTRNRVPCGCSSSTATSAMPV